MGMRGCYDYCDCLAEMDGHQKAVIGDVDDTLWVKGCAMVQSLPLSCGPMKLKKLSLVHNLIPVVSIMYMKSWVHTCGLTLRLTIQYTYSIHTLYVQVQLYVHGYTAQCHMNHVCTCVCTCTVCMYVLYRSTYKCPGVWSHSLLWLVQDM